MAFNFNKLTVKAQEAFQSAIEIAQNYGNQVIEPEHLLASLDTGKWWTCRHNYEKDWWQHECDQTKINESMESLPKVSGAGVGNQQMSQNTAKLLDTAADEAKKLQDEYVSTEHLLIALSEDKGKAGQLTS